MHETKNSPTKPNEPACPECSRLASRVAELETKLGAIMDVYEFYRKFENEPNDLWHLRELIRQLGTAVKMTPDEAQHYIKFHIHNWRLASRVEELENLIAKHSGSLNSTDSASNTESSSTAKETRNDDPQWLRYIKRLLIVWEEDGDGRSTVYEVNTCCPDMKIPDGTLVCYVTAKGSQR